MLIYKLYPKNGVMKSKIEFQNEKIFEIIKLISNRLRFLILELSQKNNPTITELSSKLNLSYTKCSDYVRMLEKKGLIIKTKNGKIVRIKSNVKISDNQIVF